MDYSLIKCPTCDNFYDENLHLPKILNCGHTICYSCLDVLDQYDISSCCVDQANTVDKDSLNTNFLVLEYIQKMQQMTTNMSSDDETVQPQQQKKFTTQQKKNYNQETKYDKRSELTQSPQQTSTTFKNQGKNKNEPKPLQTESMKQITKNVVDLQKDLESEKQNYINSIEKRIVEIEQILLNKREESSELSLVVQEKNQQIQILENQIQQLQAEVEQKADKSKELKVMLQEKQKELEEIKKENQGNDQKISSLENENAELKQLHNEMKQQIQKLNQELISKDSSSQSLEIRLKNSEKDAKKWQEKLNLQKDQQ